MHDFEIVILEFGQPAGQHAVSISIVQQPFKTAVVCAERESTPPQVRPEVFCHLNHCEQLAMSRAVVSLTITHGLTSVREYAFYAIDYLAENSSDTEGRGVRV